ncbi:MAG: hypothetical protein RLZZ298_3483 [Pseudomonadota bacterium]
MSYFALKHLHITCVLLSGLGFLVRGWWMLTESERLKARLTKVLPHIVDTLLLGSALTMAYLSGQYPFAQGWLSAKLLGLLAYIVCGAMALKRGKTKEIRIIFLSLAVLSYVYIVSVALTRSPYIGW